MFRTFLCNIIDLNFAPICWVLKINSHYVNVKVTSERECKKNYSAKSKRTKKVNYFENLHALITLVGKNLLEKLTMNFPPGRRTRKTSEKIRRGWKKWKKLAKFHQKKLSFYLNQIINRNSAKYSIKAFIIDILQIRILVQVLLNNFSEFFVFLHLMIIHSYPNHFLKPHFFRQMRNPTRAQIKNGRSARIFISVYNNFWQNH